MRSSCLIFRVQLVLHPLCGGESLKDKIYSTITPCEFRIFRESSWQTILYKAWLRWRRTFGDYVRYKLARSQSKIIIQQAVSKSWIMYGVDLSRLREESARQEFDSWVRRGNYSWVKNTANRRAIIHLNWAWFLGKEGVHKRCFHSVR